MAKKFYQKVWFKSVISAFLLTSFFTVIFFLITGYEKESKLKILIASLWSKQVLDSGQRSLDILNPSINQTVSLWMTADGDSTIYVENIEYYIQPNYWAGFIENKQPEIKGGQTIEIPLRHIFDDECWSMNFIGEDPSKYDAYAYFKIKVTYRTKNKLKVEKYEKAFPINLKGWEPLNVSNSTKLCV